MVQWDVLMAAGLNEDVNNLIRILDVPSEGRLGSPTHRQYRFRDLQMLNSVVVG